jgi:CDP-diacylglycerol--glycerol-3-phosphate 3-phosphatidyltransferase
MHHLPNILSLLRIIIAPVFLVFIISNDSFLISLAFFLFSIGAISDYLDGWLARKFHAVSQFGNFFDPLADKFLTSFAFIGFSIIKVIPLWMTLIVIIRDIVITFLRLYQLEAKSGLITSNAAKFKTFFQMVFIFFILTFMYCYYNNLFYISESFYNKVIDSIALDYIMGLIVILTLWTLFDYVYQFKFRKN